MPQIFKLNQTLGWLNLGGGTRLRAPGLTGTVVWRSAAEHAKIIADALAPNMGAAAAPQDPIEKALREAGLTELGSSTFPVGTTSISSTPAHLAFDRPRVANQIEFAIYRDEGGVISLHRPLPTPPPAAVPAAGGAAVAVALAAVQPGSSYHYDIPVRQAATPKGAILSKTMLGGIAGKVIRFVGRAVTGLAGDAVYLAAKTWEDHYRVPQGIYDCSTLNLLTTEPPPLPLFSNWPLIQGSQSLLFIHGTISSTAGAFGGLNSFLAESTSLYQKYNNRVIGFNHHTLTKSVPQNVVDFLNQLPAGNYQFDVVCHSRGGLVARTLKELTPTQVGQLVDPVWVPPANLNVQIGKIALVGVPNQGTPLCKPDDLAETVSRLTSIATSLSGDIAAFGLGALFAIFGGIVEGGMGALPGLEDMNPGSPFLTELNAASSNVGDYYAIEANYQPSGGLAEAIENDGVDALFQSAENDLVVPTLGVSMLNGQTLPGTQTYPYPQGANVYHTIYFKQQETWDQILAFL